MPPTKMEQIQDKLAGIELYLAQIAVRMAVLLKRCLEVTADQRSISKLLRLVRYSASIKVWAQASAWGSS